MNREINPEYLKHWINGRADTSTLCSSIIGYLLLLVDFVMIAPLFADPFEAIYFQILIPPTVLLHLWGLWIVISPYKNQVASELYMGIFGVFVTVGYGICSMKMFYGVLGFTTPLYAIALAAVYIAGYYALFKRHFQNLSSGYYYDHAVIRSGDKKNSGLKYASFGGLGVFLGNLVVGMASGNTTIGLLAGLFLFFAALNSLLTLSIHRYVLMKRYPELTIIQRKPVKKTSKHDLK